MAQWSMILLTVAALLLIQAVTVSNSLPMAWPAVNNHYGQAAVQSESQATVQQGNNQKLYNINVCIVTGLELCCQKL